MTQFQELNKIFEATISCMSERDQPIAHIIVEYNNFILAQLKQHEDTKQRLRELNTHAEKWRYKFDWKEEEYKLINMTDELRSIKYNTSIEALEDLALHSLRAMGEKLGHPKLV